MGYALPGWVPYRVRNWFDNRRVASALRGLRDNPPAPVPTDAAVDVHMLLCRRDVAVGVLALKSLLRFRDFRATVSLTDDGSLSAADRAFVDAHIPGARWLPARSDDPAVRAALATRPRLAALYAGSFVLARKLIHPLTLGRAPRVLVLDADTATFRRPDELIRWANDDGPAARYLYDRRQPDDAIPLAVHSAFDEMRPTGGSGQLPHLFFNSGLLALRPADFDLDIAERYLAWLDAAPPELKTGRPGIWFGPWTTEQTAYLWMTAALDPPAEPFGPEYGIGHGEPHTFHHFLRSGLLDPATLARLRALVRELGAKG